MKNILVPIDFSPCSLNAARAAVFIGEKTNASTYLLHVVDAPADWNKISVRAQQEFPEVEARVVEAEVKMEKLASDPLFANSKIKTVVLGGVIHESIADYAYSHKMNLIVIGAHGAGESNEMFVGSTTQRVIRLAACPVLSMKKDTKLKTIERILFLSDFEEDVSKAIRTVSELAEVMQAEVDLLYINTPSNFEDTGIIEQRMARYTPRNKKVKFHQFIYDDLDKEQGMLNFIKTRHPDLLAMVTHPRRGKPSYLLSVTDTLLFHADVPLLSSVLKD